MHLKNFSLIYPVDGMVQLSPAYDLLATRLILSETDDPEESALTINGKKSSLNLEDFLAFGAYSGLTEKQIHKTLQNFQNGLPSCFNVIDKSFLSAKNKKEFKKLLTDRASRLKIG